VKIDAHFQALTFGMNFAFGKPAEQAVPTEYSIQPAP